MDYLSALKGKDLCLLCLRSLEQKIVRLESFDLWWGFSHKRKINLLEKSELRSHLYTSVAILPKGCQLTPLPFFSWSDQNTITFKWLCYAGPILFIDIVTHYKSWKTTFQSHNSFSTNAAKKDNLKPHGVPTRQCMPHQSTYYNKHVLITKWTDYTTLSSSALIVRQLGTQSLGTILSGLLQLVLGLSSDCSAILQQQPHRLALYQQVPADLCRICCRDGKKHI